MNAGIEPGLPERKINMNNNDYVKGPEQNNVDVTQKFFIGLEKPCRVSQRKFDRRTLTDRRRPGAKSNYKGPERRYHNRRSGTDRRGDFGPKDDLRGYFPGAPD